MGLGIEAREGVPDDVTRGACPTCHTLAEVRAATEAGFGGIVSNMEIPGTPEWGMCVQRDAVHSQRIKPAA